MPTKTTRRASAPIHGFKDFQLQTEAEGTFEAVVAVFGNVDLGGDRILPGAFAKSLDTWKETDAPIPVIWSHGWDDPSNHIGEVLEAKELYAGDEQLPEAIRGNGGLWIKGRLDMEEPRARQAWKLMKSRRVKEFSFAYDVPPGGERPSGDGANDLVQLDVIEVGPTLKGMNPITQLIEVKNQPAAETELDDQAAADGAKAYVTLEGSMEERQESIMQAIYAIDRQTLDSMANGGLYAPWLEATYDDRAVVLMEGWNDPAFEGRYWQFPVTVEADGAVSLGEPVEVNISGTVTPKARAKTLKAFTKQRASALDGRDGVKSDGNPEDPTEGNGEDPQGEHTSATGTREADPLLVELELLELS